MRWTVLVMVGMLGGCGLSHVYYPGDELSPSQGGGTTGASSGGTSSGGSTITVTTLAGNGIQADQDGSGGRNGTAAFGWPEGLGLDAAGNVFVADTWSNDVRRISPSGTVTTWAGNGSPGFLDGTGGPNGSAQLSGPVALTVAPNGEIFVADTVNSVVRAIDLSGNVTTLPATESDGLPFHLPGAIAIGPTGNLYLADTGNQRICVIDPQGNVSTLAGSPFAGYADGNGAAAQFNNPYGLAVDPSGNVYVGDSNNNRIRKIDPAGNVTTVAGNGTAGDTDGQGAAAEFNLPSGLALDQAGELIVADCTSNRIRSLDPNGNVTTVAGNGRIGDTDGTGGPNGPAEFDCPLGVAVDATGNIYVGGNNDHRVRKISF